MKAVILVPRRPDNGRRDVLWSYCKGQLERIGLPLYESDHVGATFSRSQALNNAAAEAGDWDVAYVSDADLVLAHPRQAITAVANAASGRGYVLPCSTLVMLDEEGTNRVLDGAYPQRQEPMLTHQSWIGSFAITHDLWRAVGGFDERFVGYGGQDIAFLAAAGTLGGRMRGRGRLYHLWHPYRSRDNAHFVANMALLKRYQDALDDKPSMRALLAECPPVSRPPGHPSVLASTTSGKRKLGRAGGPR